MIYIVYLLLMIYGWLIVARALLSWFPTRPGSSMASVIGPVGLDLSAVVGLIVLFIIIQVLARL